MNSSSELLKRHDKLIQMLDQDLSAGQQVEPELEDVIKSYIQEITKIRGTAVCPAFDFDESLQSIQARFLSASFLVDSEPQKSMQLMCEEAHKLLDITTTFNNENLDLFAKLYYQLYSRIFNYGANDEQTLALVYDFYNRLYQLLLDTGDLKPQSYQPVEGRVLYITEQALSPVHSPTKTLLHFCSLLRQKNCEVLVAATSLLPEIMPLSSFPDQSFNQNRQQGLFTFDGHKEQAIYQLQKTIIPACLALKNLIEKYRPQKVFVNGGNNLIADVVAGELINCNTTLGNQLPSARWGKLVQASPELTPRDRLMMKLMKREEKDCLQLRQPMLPMELKNEGEYDRLLSKAGENLHIGIISNRLENECSNAFLTAVDRLCQERPGLEIHFVKGTKTLQKILADFPALQEASSLYPYQELLWKFMQQLDICLLPPGSGNGTTAFLACLLNIPLIAASGSDAAQNSETQLTYSDPKTIADLIATALDAGWQKENELRNRSLLDRAYDAEEFTSRLLNT
jgi:hypothetical protein